MKVSIIIPTYNREQYISGCLESIFRLSYKPSQVIVVDDGSTDGTRDAVRPWLDRIEFYSRENAGKAAALNFALGKVTGDCVWTFDDDDLAVAGGLGLLVDALDRSPDTGFAYGSFVWVREDQHGKLRKSRDYRLPHLSPDEIFVRLLEGCFFIHSATLVRTACYNEVGAFDVELRRSQDYDMLLRLCRRYVGIGIDVPVLLVREHEGIRGSGPAAHVNARRQDVHLEYDARVFKKLYDSLAIEEYLPWRPHMSPLTPEQLRRALLTRGSALAKRALWREAMADFSAAAHTVSAPLSDSERRSCLLAFSNPTAIRKAPDVTYFSKLRRILTGRHGAEMRASLAHGLYRAASSEWADNEFGRAWRAARLLPTLAGLDGLVNLARAAVSP